MKTRVVLLLLAMTVGVTVFAQPRRMTAQERADQMEKQLSLTADQKTKILELFTQQEKEMAKRPMGDQGDREAWRAAMEKRREQQDLKLKSILTSEQYAQYEQMRGKMSRGRMGRPEKAGGPASLEKTVPSTK